MKAIDFAAVVDHRCDMIRAVLDVKAKEYASDADRLHNFKRAAALLDCHPAQACVGMLAKHLVSVLDIVDALAKGKLPDKAMVNEKVGDAVNYLILLEGLIEEERS